MGKGHKDRRREQRAREIGEREADESLSKDETDPQVEEDQLEKKPAEEIVQPEKSIETSSDTDSGHGSSTTTTSSESPKAIQSSEPTEHLKRRSLIKGLQNIGNTCFFNVIIQSLAHSPLLTDKLHQSKSVLMEEIPKKYASTTTTQLVSIFEQFTSDDRKRASIDPRPLFNSLIQKVPSYKGYDQHDSHELFMNLMLILRAEETQMKHLEVSSTSNSTDGNDPSKMFCVIGCNEPYTTYDSIFGGHLLDVLTCKKCEKSLMKIEPFLGLLLPLTDRLASAENFRQRRKRDDNTGHKTKKEPKILSRKQQKALKKQEKRNSRKSATAPVGKIKSRQVAKKDTIEEPLPLEEPTSPLPAEEVEAAKEVDQSEGPPVEAEEKPVSVVETNENGDPPSADEDDDDDDDEEEDGDEPKGPLTAVESTCTLSDMVSKLTLIHETSSRPLPFVDASTAEQFLNCHLKKGDAATADEAEDIRTLEHCFQRYFKPETLTGENSFDCYYCRSLEKGQNKVLTEATRQTVFLQLPPIIPIFLKRFQMHGSSSGKIQKFIEFPLRLDLNHRCSSQIKTSTSVYSLYAVIEHSGTLRSGHYIAYIKQSAYDDDTSDVSCSQPIDSLLRRLFQSRMDEPCVGRTAAIDPSQPPPSWYHISDNAIHKVPESKVLEADAYVLFYRRIQNEA